MNCTQCGAGLPAGARFCGQCGAPVASAAPAAPAAAAAPAAPAASLGFAPPQGTPVTDTAQLPDIAPDVAPAPSTRHGRGRVWLIAGCAVLAVAVVGVVAWLLLRSDESAAGGAGSPEDVATGFAAAMSKEDLLAASGFVSPLETPGLDQLLTTLRDAAKEQGIAGLSAGDGVDVQMALRPDRVTELADGISRVELSMDLSIEGTPGGPVGALLGDRGVDIDERDVTDAFDADALTIVVVQESGRWYVSPMLTIGEYAADALDLPGPRYDLAAAPEGEQTAPDEEEAVRQIGDAIEQRDAALAAGALAPGEARFVRVFGRAIDDLLDRIDGDLSFDKLDMSEQSNGRWSIDHVEIINRNEDDAFGLSGVQIDGDCVTLALDLSVDDLCLGDLDWLSSPLDDDRFVVHTSRDGDSARLELAATVIDDLGQLATRVTRSTLLDALGLEILDTPTPVTVDEPLGLTFSGEDYRVVEWRAAPERSYLVQLADGDIGAEADIYASDGGTGWYWVDWVGSEPGVLPAIDDVTTYRAVVRVDSECDGLEGTCAPATGDVELDVQRLQTIPADVGTVVKPMVGPGHSVLLEIPADAEHRYEVTSETDGILLRDVEYGSVYELVPDDDGYLSVPYADSLDILVTNTGSAEVRAEVAIREHDLAGGGDVPVGEGVSLDLSSGEATYVIEAADITSITVTASPDDGQDITLDVSPCDVCYADLGYAGESETTTFDTNGEISFTVTVTAFSDADAYGTVTLTYDLF